jgi:cellulose biosynthesis protein BcsQ
MNLFKEMGFDYVIFDTSPAMSSITLAIFVVSDAVICPAHLHSFSYKAINKTIETIIKNNKNNKTETKLLGIIPNDITPNSTKQQLALGQLVSAYPGKILPPLLSRKPFSDAMDKLIPVWEMKPQESNIKKASHEMIKLMNGLDKTLEKELA